MCSISNKFGLDCVFYVYLKYSSRTNNIEMYMAWYLQPIGIFWAWNNYKHPMFQLQTTGSPFQWEKTVQIQDSVMSAVGTVKQRESGQNFESDYNVE